MMEFSDSIQQDEKGFQMNLLAHRITLEKRIKHGILKLLLCDIDKLSARFILELQKDLEEWYG